MLVRSLSPALGHRVLFAHALLSWSGWVDPGILLLLLTGPRSSSLMTSWVPGSLAYCCLFLAVVLGRCNRQGPITKSPSEGETLPKNAWLQKTCCGVQSSICIIIFTSGNLPINSQALNNAYL